MLSTLVLTQLHSCATFAQTTQQKLINPNPITSKTCVMQIAINSLSFLACNSYNYVAPYSTLSSTEGGSEPNCCFGERKVVLFQILLDGAEPRNARTT